jgi:hypothetical protein
MLAFILETTTTTDTKRRRAKPGEARAWLDAYIANFHAAEDITACVLWPFAVNGRGYPCISVNGASKLVTRIVMERVSGAPLSNDELMCHTCDTPRCVNPWHLYSGDDATNTADKIERCRQARGDGSGRAKLTADVVREMRAAFTGRYGEVITLARRYDVDPHTITDALNGVTWCEVN